MSIHINVWDLTTMTEVMPHTRSRENKSPKVRDETQAKSAQTAPTLLQPLTLRPVSIGLQTDADSLRSSRRDGQHQASNGFAEKGMARISSLYPRVLVQGRPQDLPFKSWLEITI